MRQPQMQDATTPPDSVVYSSIAIVDAAQRFGIRELVGSDVPFIFRSWITSYRRSAFAKGIRDRVYFAHQHRLIEAILRRGRVRVAYVLNDPDTIIGYLVLTEEPNVLHYAFVKSPFRREHVLTSLIPEGDWFYSHRSDDSDRIIGRFPQLTFNPYIAFGG